jgi:phosphoglucosamine mutase
MLAGLQLLSVVARSGRPLAELAGDAMVDYPQVLKNLRMNQRHPELITKLGPAIEQAEREMADDGRVLVRLSGTEPLLRVMVEHVDQAVADATADKLIAAALSFIG